MRALDLAVKVAQLVLAALAVSPLLHKAFHLLRTAPRETTEERTDRIVMRVSDRMGLGQKLWMDFLDWCRTYDADKLTWRERRARNFWCPLVGHDLVDFCRPAGHFSATCRNCQLVIMMDTEDALDEWGRKGGVPWGARSWRVRER